MKPTLAIILIFFLDQISIADDTSPTPHDTWNDFKTSLDYMGRGSYLQFQGTQNLVMWAIATGSVLYYLHNDERILKHTLTERNITGLHRTVSDAGVFFNTPAMPMLFYGFGRYQQNDKMIRFSQEYLATLGISLIEGSLISMLPMHERPNTTDTNFWEENFRHQSSFPSGHVIGYMALACKSFQFYGPLAATLPFSLAVITAYERVRTEKHYTSDVIASGFLTLLASEGVRMASNYPHYHPLYQWIFIHNFQANYIKHHDIPGLLLSFRF